MLLQNLFDSHVHWLLTGQVASDWDLRNLTDPSDLLRHPRPESARRGPWTVGFGWDENKWSIPRAPHWRDLESLGETPIYLIRCDGHSGWTNRAGLRELGWWDGKTLSVPEEDRRFVQLDADGQPTGILTETLHYKAWNTLPQPTRAQKKDYLKKAMTIFNRAGFTQIRDMAGDRETWELAKELELAGELTLNIDWNFPTESVAELEKVLKDARRCANEGSNQIRVRGIKFYFDGSLGSDTAWISVPYAHRNDGHRGVTCWSIEDATEVMRRSWQAGFEVAVHTIGDAAVDQIVEIARVLSAQGISGRLNLEHCQVARRETLQKMKALHVALHFQPCHWLSDRVWLKEKLGSLMEFAFPWEAARRLKIPFWFGSDSPIEEPSFAHNLQALEESGRNGIVPLQGEPVVFHCAPADERPLGETMWQDGRAVGVRFGGRVLFGHFPED